MLLTPKAYLLTVLALAIPGIICANIAVWVGRVSECRALDDPGTYIAECNHPYYGDYEHGAFYYNLEARLASSLERAEVLFVGSSQAQFAFSTGATRAFFERRGVRYYLMGFGYNEGATFPADLIEKYRLRPKLIIMNAGYFLNPALSKPAQTVTSGSVKPLIESELKHLALSISREICRRAAWVCSREYGAIYRSIYDGHWIWENLIADPDKAEPIPSDVPQVGEGDFDYFKDSVQVFLKRSGVSGRCVVITSAPNNDRDWSNVSEYIGAKLGLTVVLPKLSGMATIDGSHLNKASAEIWSTAVLDELAPTMNRCLGHRRG